MSEIALQYIVFGNICALALSSLFYGLGGMDGGRVMRRFISPAIIFLSIVVTSLILHKWSYLILAVLPVLILRNSLGYSGDRGMPSWVKRSLIATLSIVSGILLCIAFSGGWFLLILHGFVAMSTVFFAFKSPIVARAEEPLICLLLNVCTIMYPFLT